MRGRLETWSASETQLTHEASAKKNDETYGERAGTYGRLKPLSQADVFPELAGEKKKETASLALHFVRPFGRRDCDACDESDDTDRNRRGDAKRERDQS